jgi:flagellar motor switch protein FliN/FliY
MSQNEVTPREALTRLGASTGEAIAQVLEMFVPGGVQRGEVSVLPDGATPFTNLPFGAVATSVSYVDGVTGANIFLMTPAGARALAAAMGVAPSAPAEGAEGEAVPSEFSELELSAIGEAANQMMAAAASAISVVLGQEVEISPPETRILDDPGSAVEIYGRAPHSTSTTFVIGAEACRLIQLVPSAFVVRMARAIDELSMEQPTSGDGAQTGPSGDGRRQGAARDAGTISLREALSDINLRVWAELGRTRMPLGQALELPLGAVVDLDRASDASVDLFVNGLRFGQGHLLVTDDGEWAICLETVAGTAPAKPHGGRSLALETQ